MILFKNLKPWTILSGRPYFYQYVYVRENDRGEKGVYAKQEIKKGDQFYVFHPYTHQPQPTRTSIQAGGRHLEDEIGQYLNHSCSPNAKIEVSHDIIGLVALKAMNRHQEIVFDYKTTETEISHPFKCSCHGEWIR